MAIEDGGPIVKEWELPCNVLLSKIHRWLHDFEAITADVDIHELPCQSTKENPYFRLGMPTSPKSSV